MSILYQLNDSIITNQWIHSMDEDFFSLEKTEKTPNWTLQEGYSTIDKDVHPQRVFGYGDRAGLVVVLKLFENDTDFICRGPVQNFKVVLHTPGEIPQVSKQFFRIQLSQEVLVSVKPNLVTTLEGLKEYPPEKRDCFFNDEKTLKFFKVYAQRNCELECLANFTLKACGCVKFSMPRDNKTSICSQTQIQCYNKAVDDLMEAELLASLKYPDGFPDISHHQCNCLPDCNTINYDYELSQADYRFHELFNAYEADSNEISGLILARITIAIKDEQFSTTTRSENYGLYEFIGNCGGLLGLFMGVSLISVIELIYYFTLRLACNFGCRQKLPEVRSNTVAADIPEPNVIQDIQTKTDIIENNNLNEVKIM